VPFFQWLDTALTNNESINELTIDEMITGFRAKQKVSGISFQRLQV
jgi:Xaa-Pro aminopeptidase